MFVAGGDSDSASSTIQYSLNGSNWSPAVTGGFNGNYGGLGVDVAFGNNRWVAVGLGESTIQYSIDGSNWLPAQVSGFDQIPLKISYNNSTWVAHGSNQIIYSKNGSNWSSSNIPFFQTTN
jgi:hypothetical protein